MKLSPAQTQAIEILREDPEREIVVALGIKQTIVYYSGYRRRKNGKDFPPVPKIKEATVRNGGDKL